MILVTLNEFGATGACAHRLESSWQCVNFPTCRIIVAYAFIAPVYLRGTPSASRPSDCSRTFTRSVGLAMAMPTAPETIMSIYVDNPGLRHHRGKKCQRIRSQHLWVGFISLR